MEMCWCRRDLRDPDDGRLRQLHIEQLLAAADGIAIVERFRVGERHDASVNIFSATWNDKE